MFLYLTIYSLKKHLFSAYYLQALFKTLGFSNKAQILQELVS